MTGNKDSEADWRRRDGLPAQLSICIPFAAFAFVGMIRMSYLLSPLEDAHPVNSLRYVVLAVLVVRELVFERRTMRELAGFVLGAAMLCIAEAADEQMIAESVCLVFFARHVDLKILARFVFAALLVSFAVVVMCSAAGLIVDDVYADDPSRGVRHALGFVHPNAAMLFPLFIVATWTYQRGEGYTFVDALACALFVWIIFRFTGGRGALMAALVFVAAACLWRYLPHRWRSALPLGAIAAIALLVIIGGSLALVFAYDPDVEWMARANALLTHRLEYAHGSLEDFGIPLLGQSVTFGYIPDPELGSWLAVDTSHFVDNVYARLLIHCGLLFTAVGLVLLVAGAVWAGREGDGMLVVALVALALYGAVEMYAAVAMFNIFLVAAASLFAEPAPGAPAPCKRWLRAAAAPSPRGDEAPR